MSNNNTHSKPVEMSESTTSGAGGSKAGKTRNVCKEKWCPRTERLAGIMKKSRRKAEIEHARREMEKKTKLSSHYRLKKPSRAVTSRQLSSKRSAEICRAKMAIYIGMVEDTVQEEVARQSQLRNSLFFLRQANAALAARVSEHLEAATQPHPQQYTQSFSSVLSSEPGSAASSDVVVDTDTDTAATPIFGTDELFLAPCTMKTAAMADDELVDYDQFMHRLEEEDSPCSQIGESPFMFASDLMEPFSLSPSE